MTTAHHIPFLHKGLTGRCSVWQCVPFPSSFCGDWSGLLWILQSLVSGRGYPSCSRLLQSLAPMMACYAQSPTGTAIHWSQASPGRNKRRWAMNNPSGVTNHAAVNSEDRVQTIPLVLLTLLL
ncbi:unnamed protein product [Lymnaea stagnalis]|uniref:Uncharacterized protein n=1 Tax=Lymnaea stagnalis TaxID=6523 RepID=A0AAV2IFN5_LYMST